MTPKNPHHFPLPTTLAIIASTTGAALRILKPHFTVSRQDAKFPGIVTVAFTGLTPNPALPDGVEPVGFFIGLKLADYIILRDAVVAGMALTLADCPAHDDVSNFVKDEEKDENK